MNEFKAFSEIDISKKIFAALVLNPENINPHCLSRTQGVKSSITWLANQQWLLIMKCKYVWTIQNLYQ